MAEIDPQVFLCLLAVRLQGGRSVPAAGDLFKKGLKGPLEQALADGLLTKEKEKLPTGRLNAKGQPVLKSTEVLALTDRGERLVQSQGGPEAAAALAASLRADVERRLEERWQALRREVMAAVSEKEKKPPKADGDLGKLARSLGELAARLEKLEVTLAEAAPAEPPALGRIDAAFEQLRGDLASLIAAPAAAPAPAGRAAEPTPAPAAEERTVPATLPLEAVLRRAYEELLHYREFESGLVEMPRLYDEARRLEPDLPLVAFHAALMELWERRELELKVLNEVREAEQPEKAIHRDGRLYYYVYWMRP